MTLWSYFSLALPYLLGSNLPWAVQKPLFQSWLALGFFVKLDAAETGAWLAQLEPLFILIQGCLSQESRGSLPLHVSF